LLGLVKPSRFLKSAHSAAGLLPGTDGSPGLRAGGWCGGGCDAMGLGLWRDGLSSLNKGVRGGRILPRPGSFFEYETPSG
jgi:hypothetical protein